MADAESNGDGQRPGFDELGRHRWTQEEAKRASDLAAEARARNAELRKTDPLGLLRESAGDLLADLLKAARGQPPFTNLPPDKRLAALLRALEYSVGRPAPLRRPPEVAENADEAAEAEEGLSIQ